QPYSAGAPGGGDCAPAVCLYANARIRVGRMVCAGHVMNVAFVAVLAACRQCPVASVVCWKSLHVVANGRDLFFHLFRRTPFRMDGHAELLGRWLPYRLVRTGVRRCFFDPRLAHAADARSTKNIGAILTSTE